MSSTTENKITTSIVCVKEKWEEVYCVRDAADVTELPEFQQDTKYFQTFGGGPEGGYFIKYEPEDDNDLNQTLLVLGIWAVQRNWGTPWTVEDITPPNGKVRYEYQDVNEWKGRVARMRIIRYKQRLNFKVNLLE